MKKVSLSECQTIRFDNGFIQTPLFGPETKPNEAVHFGFAEFEPDSRVPKSGTTFHDGDEFSYIISGSLSCWSKDGIQKLQAGDCVYFPSGDEHYSFNDNTEPCKLIYMLVKTI